MDRKFIAAEDISFKLGSKKNLYDLIRVDLNFVVPPYKKCSIRFIKDILAKKKLAIKNDIAKLLLVPRYCELATDKVWTLVKEVPDLLVYFPDFQEGELPDREFIWTILSTLREDAVKELIRDARKKRAVSSEEDKEELIEIDPEILKMILEAPNLNKEGERVAYLLKSKNSQARQRRKPKVCETNLSILKRNQMANKRRNTEAIEEEKEANDMNVDYQHSMSSRTSPRRGNESREIFGKPAGLQTPFKPKKPFLEF